MSKFTPGPWEVSKRFLGNVYARPDRSIANTMGYSTNTDNGEHIEENQANARLIAAAPEMYELLRHMYRTLSACLHGTLDEKTYMADNIVKISKLLNRLELE